MQMGTITYAKVSLTADVISFWKFDVGNIEEWWGSSGSI